MESGKLAELVSFGAQHSLDSLLVVRHGKIVVEAYYAPFAAGLPHTVNSCTKSIIGTLTAIALKDGSLDSSSHRVVDFFDRNEIGNLDKKKEAITIQNLLDMTSGFEWAESAYGPAPSVTEMVNSRDWVKFVLGRPMSDTPGNRFNYNSGNAHLLSAILTKVTGITASEYAKAKLFTPLGIKDVNWAHDPLGISSGPFGLFLEPRDMAKIGYLYLRNGVWEGRQLIPSDWIDHLIHATIDMHSEPGDRYSNFFWSIPGKHVYMALGAYRQMIMVFPELDIVAVTTGRADDFSSGDFADAVAGAVKSDKVLSPDATGASLLAKALLDASTEKPTEIGSTPQVVTAISGKVYKFPPNEMNLKTLSLILDGPQPRYEIEPYTHSVSNSDVKMTGPIGLDGLYRKGEITRHGLGPRFEGAPRVNAVKGTWQTDDTFVMDRLVLGLGQPPERWTLTFNGNKLNLRAEIANEPDLRVDGEATQDTTEPVWPTRGWQTSTPEEQGIDSKELAKVVDFGASRTLSSIGATPASQLDSLLIARHGKIVAEVYYAPYAAGILHQVNSVTKAITSTLIGIACKDGLLDSPNHKVLEFFDRHDIGNLDDRKEAITIQNLLDMTSGIGWSELGLEGTPNSSVSELVRTADWIRFILDRPMWTAPGLEFNYNSGNQHLLSAILTKVSGMSTLEYAKAKLFEPLGITDFYWWHDPQGITDGGFGLFLQPRDMAKIGYLYLHNGEWERKQLLPSTWIDKVNHATIDMHLGQELRYSNCFWALPEKHVYMADGYRGQVIMVFPELDVVAVTTGRANFLLNEFADLVSSSVKSDASLPADPTGVRLLAKKVGEVSTEKVTEVSPTSNTAATISGKVYHFPPNEINVKSLSLFLTGPDQRYEIEAYGNGTDSTSRLTGPIGLDGFYRKGQLTEQGANNPVFSGPPRVRAINAVKGTWVDDTTFVVDWRVLGIANSPEQRWTLSFNGNKLNVRAQLGGRPEISVDGQTGG